jgi:hypothetical protein
MSTTLYAHDSKYGVTTLTYNTSTGCFEGCVQASPSGTCGGHPFNSFALKYQMTSNSILYMFWQTSSGTIGCPQSTNCSSSSFNYKSSDQMWEVHSYSCTPFNFVFIPDTVSSEYGYAGYSTSDSVQILTTP